MDDLVRRWRKSASDQAENISTWYWNRDLVDDFILAAHKMYHKKVDNEIHIYNHT
jgi:hypothetical protein